MEMTNLVLGKSTTYDCEYAPSRLQRIKRELGRSQIKNYTESEGYDLWRLYEITYLDLNSLPKVCVGKIIVPKNSEYIVESKSLKLYIFSLTMTKFKSLEQVESVIKRDLSELLECDVKVSLMTLNDNDFGISKIDGIELESAIDLKNFSQNSFTYSTDMLKAKSDKVITINCHTNLFRSLCPVTAQPDHATMFIEYEGKEISYESLLSYLISLRNHQGFHEQCVELIYSDIMTMLKPKKLCVHASFTRRGGIDINPFRTNQAIDSYKNVRTVRQ